MHVNDVAFGHQTFPSPVRCGATVCGRMHEKQLCLDFAQGLSFLHLTDVYHLDKYEDMTLFFSFFYFSPLER